MVNEVVPFEQLWARAMEVARLVAKVPAESMGMMKYCIRKVYDLRGFANSLDFTAEMFNLSRTNMQKKDMQGFKASIESGGLKSALNERYV